MSQKSVASLHMQAKWRRRFYGKEDNLLPGFMLLLDFLRGLSFGFSFLVVFAILVENTASSQFLPTKVSEQKQVSSTCELHWKPGYILGRGGYYNFNTEGEGEKIAHGPFKFS